MLFFSDIHSPSVVAANMTSISIQWNDPPPKLLGSPHRNMTQYAVTVSPQDGTESRIVFLPAEARVFVIAGLHLPNTFDIETEVVIDTEGQGVQTYDIGVPMITGKYTGCV